MSRLPVDVTNVKLHDIPRQGASAEMCQKEEERGGGREERGRERERGTVTDVPIVLGFEFGQ
jgi:hypothetical protein